MYRIGIDEVGRGPIAGPVVVSACAVKDGVLLLHLYPKGLLRDSKKLTEKQRKYIATSLDAYIKSGDVIVGIGESSALHIDDVGIVQAIKDAMMNALQKVYAQGVDKETHIMLDGALSLPDTYSFEVLIKGDEKILEISLASIFAKECRDNLMKALAKEEAFSGYGFEQHVGYGTAQHYKAIQEKGLTVLHRKTFLKNMKNS